MASKILDRLPADRTGLRNVEYPSNSLRTPESANSGAEVGPSSLRQLVLRRHSTEFRHNGIQVRSEVFQCHPSAAPGLCALGIRAGSVRRSSLSEELGDVCLDPIFPTARGCLVAKRKFPVHGLTTVTNGGERSGNDLGPS